MSLGQDNRGVAEGVGVILMITIAVALAVSLFFFGKILSEQGEEKSLVSFRKDASATSVQVVHVGEELDWADDIAISGTCTPTLNGGPMPSGPGTRVAAGDVLDCDSGESLRLVHVADNKILYDTTF